MEAEIEAEIEEDLATVDVHYDVTVEALAAALDLGLGLSSIQGTSLGTVDQMDIYADFPETLIESGDFWDGSI